MTTFRSATKVDKAGHDQAVSGTSAIKITFQNVRWDLNGDYYSDHFYPPTDGLYFSGAVIALKSMVTVSSAILDLYRNGSFYQRLDQAAGTTSLLLRGAAVVPGLQTGTDYFDMYLTMTGLAPSATIDASSAWSTFFYTDVAPSELNL